MSSGVDMRSKVAALIKGKQKVVVVGLGITGVDTAKFLLELGVGVVCLERTTEESYKAKSKYFERVNELRALGAEVFFGCDGEAVAPHLGGVGLAVLSPGVSLESAVAGALEARSIPMASEFELGIELSQQPAVVVTGSNGKSTTVSLIEAIFKAAGMAARLCGNIGTPVIAGVLKETVMGDATPKDERLVVEASSYQLEACSVIKPKVGVLLNLSDNHLERHGTLERYLAAKARVFAQQDKTDFAVLNADDPYTRSLVAKMKGRVVLFGADESRLKEYDHARIAFDPAKGSDTVRVSLLGRSIQFDLKKTRLLGLHNRYDIAAAAVGALLLDAPADAVQRAIDEFVPLEHRLEPVADVSRAIVVNDSKSTTVAASVAAIESMREAYPERKLTVMLGGLAKAGSWEPVVKTLKRHEEFLKPVICFGQDANIVSSHCRAGNIPCRNAKNLAEGVSLALDQSTPDDVVLLTPGCASFDEFRDFEERGARFKSAVREFSAAV
ncbi:MAG: UDP-N-acetylmuramoylalanine-D-glutamate ligase [Pseudomonadota bacterium]